jgi:hypothetical protein
MNDQIEVDNTDDICYCYDMLKLKNNDFNQKLLVISKSEHLLTINEIEFINNINERFKYLY